MEPERDYTQPDGKRKVENSNLEWRGNAGVILRPPGRRWSWCDRLVIRLFNRRMNMKPEKEKRELILKPLEDFSHERWPSDTLYPMGAFVI